MKDLKLQVLAIRWPKEKVHISFSRKLSDNFFLLSGRENSSLSNVENGLSLTFTLLPLEGFEGKKY